MWSLKSINDSTCINFLTGIEYVVGRKSADVVLGNDGSVSRRHALIKITHPEENMCDPSKIPVFTIQDAASKYGTYRNNNRIGDDIVCKGDIIKFGHLGSEFRVCYSPFVITTSCIDVSKKSQLKILVKKLGGHIVNEWRPCCTHLVMSDVKVTIKALCCLVALKPIVTPKYISTVVKNIMNKSMFPDHKDFIPPIGEAVIEKDLVSFDIAPSRKTIFQNKTFLFLDEKQMKKLHLAITTAGGNTALLSERKEFNADLIAKTGHCVVQPLGQFSKDERFVAFLKKVFFFLRREKKRMIPESDLGLAVAYCSTEKFCNPYLDVGATLIGSGSIPSQTYSQQEVYVPDTDEATNIRKRARLDIDVSAGTTGSSKQTSIQPLSSNKTIQESQESTSNKRKQPADENEVCEIVQPALMAKKIKVEDQLYIPLEQTVTTVPSENGDDKSDIEVLFVKGEPSSYSENIEVETEKTVITIDDSDNNTTVSSSKRKHNEEQEEDAYPTKKKPLCEIQEISSPKSINGITTNKEKKPLCEIQQTSLPSPKSINGITTNKDKVRLHHGIVSPKFNEEGDGDDDVPCNLVNVVLADLIVKKPAVISNHITTNENGKNVMNFKKFRKVLHAGTHILPKIIGGADLMPHNKCSSRAVDEWLQNQEEEQESVENGGEFN